MENVGARSSEPRPGLEPAEVVRFYCAAIVRLLEARVPFMIGGGYAFRHYTGIERWTKDLDLFVRPADVPATLEVLEPVGTHAGVLYPHWLGKVWGHDDAFIDIVYSSGNGLAVVDDEWLRHAPLGEVLGLRVRVCPPEETIWSKAFVSERERYDGADIAHLIRMCGETMDWPRLLRRFGEHWRVLFSHLVLYGYVYPAERHRVPAWVLGALSRRLAGEAAGTPPDTRLCRGTLLSREQYLTDIADDGYLDARLPPSGRMTPAEIICWTRAIGDSDLGLHEAGHEHRRHR
jgi:hypothetical protein